ncbi:unnamed protein product [Cercopithifilaria johnstoni]|uniref:Uncharacterized protein n=1 Tax=Cercopithifilaria johnstoni TaxID=2874296 RepID=A0A8J2M7U6_9BILA|nr:unnamed protein product [Cercopithifilaria johnstoni]
MRSCKTVALRGTCAMFGNRCCSLLHHHRLLPMELTSLVPSTLIILITVIIGTQVEAIQFADPFPSSPFSTIISSSQHGSKTILAGMRIRRNANNYLTKRLHDIKRDIKLNDLQANDIRNENDIITSQRFMYNDASLIDRSIQTNRDQFAGFRFSGQTATIARNQQQALQKKPNLLQQAQNITLTNSPLTQVHSQLIPSNFSRLTNRQDCNGSDCLKNNDAISLYIPRENNTNDGQLAPLLLLSNNPSSSNNRKNHNPQVVSTLKLPQLQTGIKILGPDVQQPQKPIPLSPIDTSYHVSQTNPKNHIEYGSVKLPEVGPIPPFAGGAELTDFIQPVDTAMQTHRVYENIIPNHISTAAYYDKNKHYLRSASGNRGIYGDFHSAPLVQFGPKLGIYEEPVTFSSPSSVYSTYSTEIADDRTSSSHYESQYNLQSVSFNFNELFDHLITCLTFIFSSTMYNFIICSLTTACFYFSN